MQINIGSKYYFKQYYTIIQQYTIIQYYKIIQDRQNRYLIKLQNPMLSQLDRQFLKRQIKILPSDPNKWHKEQLIRLLALLKLPQQIQKQFAQQALQTNQIKTLTSVLQKLQGTINQTNYFPFHKLKYTINMIINAGEDDSNNSSMLLKGTTQKNQQININEQAVKLLVQAIDKLYDTQIIELSNAQILNLLKNCKLEYYTNIIKKCNIDGFNLVCSLSDWQLLKDIKNFFTGKEIKNMLEISYLFLSQYFRQVMKQLPLQKMESNITKLSQSQIQIQLPDNFQKIVKQIYSSDLTKKNSQDDIDVQFQNSELGNSQLGTSQMGNSEMGTSEMGQSQFATSERGSVYAESYADSVRGSVDCRISFRVANNYARASMMYNSEIITELRQACLSIPFDLFNLQPLQQIKIRSLKTAFGRQPDKDGWTFSVQGCKMGRDKQNDLRFPDQLSISGKHAQIIFKSQKFYLQDLGSKTGTYLRIQKTFPMQDQIYIQFSTQVEVLFKIIKKEKNQGTIKAEIKKPENLPDYKISLKQGYKIKIGRSERCHLRINNTSIFQKHSQIFFKDSNFYFKNCQPGYMSWLRLSPKSVRSQNFQLSSKKSFMIQAITSQFQKHIC